MANKKKVYDCDLHLRITKKQRDALDFVADQRNVKPSQVVREILNQSLPNLERDVRTQKGVVVDPLSGIFS